MTARGEELLAWMDDDLCTAKYPGGETNPFDFGSLCDQKAGHPCPHRALAEVAGDFRRHVVWTIDGTVLPDEKTTRDRPRDNAAGEQTSPIEGDQMM